MQIRIKNFFNNMTLSQRFMLAGLVILLGGMIGIGAWVQQQIITGVIHRTGATTALYVDSFIAPILQELKQSDALKPETAGTLSKFFLDTPMGKQIVDLRVWSTRGKLLYSTDQSFLVGKMYPMRDGLLHARLGEVYSKVSLLDDEENKALGAEYDQLLETYSPVWSNGTDQIIAVAEFYQQTDELDREISVLKQQSWLVVGMAILVIYLLLAGFVRRASETITQQKVELGKKVTQLTELLSLNVNLQGRIRRASASVVLLNEGYLRRIGSELHDGPAQDLGLSLLKLDNVIGRLEKNPFTVDNREVMDQLSGIEASMQNALKEMRGIAAGLSLPQLMELDLSETIVRVVHTHERRTGTRVEMKLEPVPNEIALPIKITIYRLVQEALNNAYRHAGGAGQQVRLSFANELLSIEISDSGSGFDPEQARGDDGRLGLNGMRERVESLGGSFNVNSQAGRGTKILAQLPYQVEEGKFL